LPEDIQINNPTVAAGALEPTTSVPFTPLNVESKDQTPNKSIDKTDEVEISDDGP